MKLWVILALTLLVGLAIGVGGTLLLPPAIEPYLVSALRAPRRPVEGQVIGKQREEGHVLLKVQTDDALILATFTKRVPEIEDRKSTRLNSSHLVISYAVFCLKKTKTHVLTAASHVFVSMLAKKYDDIESDNVVAP